MSTDAGLEARDNCRNADNKDILEVVLCFGRSAVSKNGSNPNCGKPRYLLQTTCADRPNC